MEEKEIKIGDVVVIHSNNGYGGCEGVVMDNCVANNPYYVLVDVSHHPSRQRLIRCHINEIKKKNSL
jgi:hypothetical protein